MDKLVLGKGSQAVRTFAVLHDGHPVVGCFYNLFLWILNK